MAVSNGIPTLTWTNQIGVTQPAGFCQHATYHVQLLDSGNNSLASTTSLTTGTWTHSEALSNGTYTIRVRAYASSNSDCANPSDWVTETFTIGPTPTLSPVPAATDAPRHSRRRATRSPTNTPTPKATSTLPPNFQLRGCNAHTNYTVLDDRGIGILELARNYTAAIDIWGWLGDGCDVCIQGSGSLVFLDAADAPRVPQTLHNAYSDGNWTCARLTRPGSLVLVPGPPAPAITPTLSTQALSGCMVRLNYLLNLRASPWGEKIGEARYNSTLTAMARTAGWFQVDANGVTGWLSADYVTPIGTCG